MIDHVVNSVNNFIGGWYTEETSICDAIIDWHNSPNTVKAPGKSYSGNNPSKIVSKEIKDSIDSNLNDFPTLRYEYFKRILMPALELYKIKYPWADKLPPYNVIEPVGVQYYPPGGGFHAWHCERTGSNTGNRHLVFMTYLNTVTDGGQTEFLNQNIKVKAEKGLTLIWPTDWTHVHRGIASMSQEKYIITGWFSFIENTKL
jgi:hypothetical protein